MDKYTFGHTHYQIIFHRKKKNVATLEIFNNFSYYSKFK